MRFTQLYYAHSQVTCRGPTRILYTCCWSWMKTGITLFLKKGRKLTLEDQGYARHRLLVAGLSTRRLGFDCWPVHVMSVVDKVTMEQFFFFSEYLGFPVPSFSQFTFTLKFLLSEGQARKPCGTSGYGAQ
jgi:hypothetical protein